eukprot:gene4296-7652_t
MSVENKDEFVPIYRLLGNSGIRVHRYNLGTMMFGDTWKGFMGATSDDDILKILGKYYEVGGNFIDTANVYQFGKSEEKIAWGLKKLNLNRDDFVLATKFSNTESSVRLPNNKGNSTKSIFQAVNSSLKRLDTNYIDLLYVHFWDFTTDNDVLMRALDDLVRCGKVLNIAISDAPAWEVASCNVAAKIHGWSQFVAYQGRYSLTDRECENDLIPMCQKLKLSYVPWGVLGQGKLTGKRIKGQETKDVSRSVEMSDLDYTIQDEVISIAKELGKSASSVATNWMLSRPSVSSLLLGPRNYEQFEDNLKAFDFKLSKEHLDRLNKVSDPAVKPIFPRTFIGTNYQDNQWLYFGEKKYQIE